MLTEPSLNEIIGEAVVSQTMEWLGIKSFAIALPCSSENNISTAIDIIKDTDKYTDADNANLFAVYSKNKAIYCHQMKSWLIWDKQRWKIDSNEEINSIAMDIAFQIAAYAADKRDNKLLSWSERARNGNAIRATVKLAQSLIYIDEYELDTNHYLLNVVNGTMNLKTGELQPHDREDYITKIAPVMYDKDADCPLFKSVLERSFEGNKSLIEFMQRLIGYSLTGSTKEQGLYLLYGSGANGKSTITNIIQEMLSSYSIQLSVKALMHRKSESTNDIVEMDGARLVISTEAGKHQKFDEELIKQLTGGDKIRARQLYGFNKEFIPTCKIWMLTNSRPEIQGCDEGIWRRINMIPFNIFIPQEERDPDLPEKLKGELSGILNFAVEGCVSWYNKGLNPPDEVKYAVREYRNDMDIIAQFISDCCEVNADVSETIQNLFGGYKDWCKKEGIEEKMTNRAFSGELKKRGYTDCRKDGARAKSGIRLVKELVYNAF